MASTARGRIVDHTSAPGEIVVILLGGEWAEKRIPAPIAVSGICERQVKRLGPCWRMKPEGTPPPTVFLITGIAWSLKARAVFGDRTVREKPDAGAYFRPRRDDQPPNLRPSIRFFPS